MSKASAISAEIRNAILWLERQPGVTSVVRQKYQRTRHHNAPGLAKVDAVDAKSVRVRVYDKLGTNLLFVYAPASEQRSKWIAQVVSGEITMPVLKPTQRGEGGQFKKAQPDKQRPQAKPVEELLPQVERPRPVPAQATAEGMEAQLYDVTPDIAAQWLERNSRNRTLRQSVVNKYAADMKAGRWMVTGDAIGFDTNGVIVNGQHRLWGVFESGVTVRMLVAFNLAPEVVSVLDDHLKRNLSDVAKIRRPGSTVSTAHTAIAKMLLTTVIMSTSLERRAALERVTRQDELDALDRHWDAIEFAFRECFRSRKVRSVVVAPVLTAVARAYYTQDRERLRHFGTVMLNGVMDTQDDKAAVLLRNYLIRLATDKVKAPQETIYRKAERALSAFVSRENISTLYEAGSEMFPLPEETTAGARARR